MSTPGCFAQVTFRLAGGNVLGRIEAGKVFPDYFLSRVAFDFLRAGVPRHHVPVRIKHVDRVFFYAIHQDVELLGSIAQW